MQGVKPGRTERRRWPTVLLAASAGLVLLLAAVSFWLNRAFPPERLAALIAQRVHQTTGREFRIDGELSFQILPAIGVVARDLALANAPWGTRKEMLRVGRAELRVELVPLLAGRVVFERAVAEDVDLWLETNSAGDGNWRFDRPAGRRGDEPAGASSSAGVDLLLQAVQVSRARLRYRDGRSGNSHEGRLESFELVRDGDATQIEASLALDRMDWRLKGRTGSLAALAAGGVRWPFDLTLTGPDASLRVQGEVERGPAPESAGARVDARLASAKALAPWLDAAAVLPMPIELRAKLRYTPEFVSFEDMDLALAGQRVRGHGSVQAERPWAVRAELESPAIDLGRWLPAAAPSPTDRATSASPARLFGPQPLPFDLLTRVPADLRLRIAELRRPGMPTLTSAQLRFRAEPGQARVEGLSFGVAGGRVNGGVTVRPQAGATTATLALRLAAKDVSAARLSQESGAGDTFGGGHLDLNLNLSSSGRSPSELAAGATGEVLLDGRDLALREGAMPVGPNLLPGLFKALRLDGGKAAPTQIECLVVRLPFKSGLAEVDRSIALETPQLAIVAKGKVDLRDETLELALRPIASRTLGIDSAQLASLVVVKGPLVKPGISLDAKGAAGVALSLGAAAASGGLSMIGQNLMRQAADPHPCRFAATGVRTAVPDAKDEAAAAKGGGPGPQELPAFLRQLFGKDASKR